MKSVWGLIASIIQLIVVFAAIISYIIIAINGETMLKSYADKNNSNDL